MPVKHNSPHNKLISELTRIVGSKNVLSSPADLYLYSADAALDRALPSLVVLPENAGQVSSIVRILSEQKKPFVARGAATSLCGGPVPLNGAVVIGLARMNTIGKLDEEKHEIFVEPGVINLKLQEAVQKNNLFFAPDPGSQKACTIGGNVATNAGGPHCLKYGVTSNFVYGLDVVLPDGKVTQLKIEDPGYDLVGFFVGTEGTLGIATRMRLKLLPKPSHVRTMLVSFPSIEEAIQTVTDIISDGLLPATLEAMDKTTVAAVEAFAQAGYPLNAEAVLLIEVDGDNPDTLEQQISKILVHGKNNNSLEFRLAKDEAERAKLWEGRRGAYPAMARLAPNVLVEDGAVPRTKLPEALKRIKQIAAEYNLRVALLFHAGDGNLHPQIVFDERNQEQTRIVKEAGYKMLKVCVELGGTISGEHGIGIDKREAMKWIFSRETLSLFRRLKNEFDPQNLCNPDKLIPLVGKSAPAPSEPIQGDDGKEQLFPMDGINTPESEAEAIKMVQQYVRFKTPFSVSGMKSKFFSKETAGIGTSKLNKIIEVDKFNCTVTAQAGISIDLLRQSVETENRFLWLAGTGSLGGIIATKASAARDLILAMTVLLPTGEVVRFGAKTMKNVAGYDAAKLLVGSWGTLGIILDVTLRLYPYPAEIQSAAAPRPFVFQEIHKRIKRAFDPSTLLAPRMLLLTEKMITENPKGDAASTPAGAVDDQAMKNLTDKFWM